ncbi:M20/M25/M40 family metallo-hydrolase [Branchiibius sp. NY16-3462-2]|uniref:M20/M25/M40 family metallo-hydrolase n=1 Tax=Branchiibius sp. NY16-3462-2 TaxID=1807500 RepID=UPI000791AC39|nr:M20/M25/M40 family metallo-hydrolase [Branchiibius sp. NY16-3462-2]KYH45119.1 dipeptidase [Branchiibius sp. NY16-3462-2]
MATEQEYRDKVAALMPQIIDELKAMVAIPSIAFPAFPAEPVHQMAQAAVDAFQRYGVPARLHDVPGGYPAVWAEIPAPEGAPTVLLYGHYDVQPAPKDQGWSTEPFVATEKDGRIYGRGAADDKSGIAIHLATLAAFEGKPPVGVKLVLEGEEETGSHLDAYVAARPDLFRADVMVVADMGNLTVGEPVLSTDLRGHVTAVVEVSTLRDPVHSGLFGGAAPDALMALIKLLSKLTDDDGTCLIPDIEATDWQGADYTEEMLRTNAGVLDGVDLTGTGSIASRLWSKPSISVLGIDAPSIDEAGNVLQPRARALVAMRIPPGQDPDQAVTSLNGFLRDNVTGGVHVEIIADSAAPGFHQGTDGPAFTQMKAALKTAYGRDVGLAGSGGSIPLLDRLRAASPQADFVLIGAEDAALSRIHGPDESVDPSEIEKMALAQVLLLDALSQG